VAAFAHPALNRQSLEVHIPMLTHTHAYPYPCDLGWLCYLAV
jgi:hypothetical protein